MNTRTSRSILDPVKKSFKTKVFLTAECLEINISFSRQILKPIHKISREQKMFSTTLSLFLTKRVSKNKNFCGLQLLISSLFFNSRMVNNEALLSETFRSSF